jgi:glycosyltransferase involved in cell wall biosynthesis
MKIAQICHRFYPHFGGIETHVQAISEELARRSHDVTVVTTDPTGRLPQKCCIKGIKVVRHKSFAPGGAYYFSPSLILYLLEKKFDVTHAHGYHSLIPLQTTLANRNGRLILTTHFKGSSHSSFRRKLLLLYRPLMSMLMGKAEVIICDSETEMENLKSLFPNIKSKFRVIPLGVDLDQLRILQRSERRRNVILCVSRLERYKGVQYLIKCLEYLPSDFCLRIVGKGSYGEELRKMASRLRVKDRVVFRENISRKELLWEYANAGIFVLLSKFEAFGVSVAEALASGLPCIVADSRALSEWIRYEGCEGIKYPINIQELALRIQNMSGNICERNSIFSWKEVVDNLEQIYETVYTHGRSL